MSSVEIEHLEQLFPSGTKILKKKLSRLTKPGENFGSVMLSLVLTISTDDSTKNYNLVAKTIPPSDFTKKLFFIDSTFRSEIFLYKKIVPVLEQFQLENKREVLDFFPRFHGGRLNLNNDWNRVDTNAVILLENLQINGYKILEKTLGFDLETTKSFLVSLAKFHGVSMALKFKQPEIFDGEILPNVGVWKMDPEYHQASKDRVCEIIDKVPQLVPLKQRICDGFDRKLKPPQDRSAFSTIIHNDVWVNNIMVKGMKVKLIDYQAIIFGSLAKDLIFFLFSSVQMDVLEEHYDDFLQLYYETITRVLWEHKCDSHIFSFEEFLNELECEASWSQFGHLIFSLFFIFATSNQPIELADLLHLEPSDLHIKKMIFIVTQFYKRNWF